ncbi:hypothetical protein DFQ26_009335 [Actinomortierella ambigua]|nr:hypothetical protein DFQ26_009335 [Actinomortierella ambigua]
MKLSTASLIAAVGILAMTTSSTHAQTDEELRCFHSCTKQYSKPIGDCILLYKGKPKHPKRIECLREETSWWLDCKESCVD